MSAMNVDRALDDIVSEKRKTRSSRGTRRGGGAGSGSGPKPSAGAAATSSARTRYSGTVPGSNTQVQRQAAAAASVQSQAGVAGEKIIISNLPYDVNEAQIKELFGSMIGPLKECTLHHDTTGKSKGIANVTFSRRGDASKAFNEYNNRLIDGKRPMKVELVVDPTKVPAATPASLASRVAPVKKDRKPAVSDQLAGVAEAMQGVEGEGGRGRRPSRGTRGRGGGRGGRGGRTKGGERPKKSVADLDAEMEDYSASATSAAAAPTAPAA